MSNKTVGIITLYNNNDNYGGIAQAYALHDYIASCGYECELINYKRGNYVLFDSNRPFSKRAQNAVLVRIERLLTKTVADAISQRKGAFQNSRSIIPHSKEFDENSISECATKYDIFVTGSDQVWRPCVVQDPYVLDFVKKGKRISYASSISQTQLPQEYSDYMAEKLSKYENISVREKDAQNYLTQLTGHDIAWVVDPVLLLDRSQWDEMSSQNPVQGDAPYLFSYLLGNMRRERKISTEIAKKNNLRQITFPHVEGRFRLADIGWGDEQIYNAGLSEFIALIKDSAMVVTDSFHAAVFAILFQKQFYVLPRRNRVSDGDMSSRLTSLLKMVGLEDRMIESASEIGNSRKIDYSTISNELNERISFSQQWLTDALE